MKIPEKLTLARTPTPIQHLQRLSEDMGIDIYVKRDDLTGVALSGNKIRKLEFLLHDAIQSQCDTVITCGAVTSNHARATAIAATQVGLKSHLILAGNPPDTPTGNLQLDLLVGATIDYISIESYRNEIDTILLKKAEQLKENGLSPYIIPTGGSNPLGLLGYLDAYNELSAQYSELNIVPDQIYCAVGSGGTYSGLMIGKAIHQSNCEIVGVLVCPSLESFSNKIRSDCHKSYELLGTENLWDESDLHLLDGYFGEGYAITNEEQLNFIRYVAQREGLILDPVYTGKAFFGLYNEAKKGNIPNNSKVLFIHTGGIFGLPSFAEKMMQNWRSNESWGNELI
jgi:D-cysteine desulfhydrase